MSANDVGQRDLREIAAGYIKPDYPEEEESETS